MTVKMSELPDKGEKLQAHIENIARLIRELNIKISKKSEQLKSLAKSGTCFIVVYSGFHNPRPVYCLECPH